MTAPARRVLLPGRADGARAACALAASGAFGSYLTYDRPGVRWFAGNVAGELVMHRDRIARRYRDEVHEVPLGPRPLRQLGDLARAWLPPGRPAFGYLGFELAHLLHGSAAVAAPGAPLAHLVLPEIEVRWDATGTVVTSTSEGLLGLAVDVLRSDRALPRPVPAPLDLTPPGSRAGYQAAVAGVLDRIGAGRLRKAIVSRRVDVPFPVDLPASYLLGLEQNTPARSFLFDLGGRRCAGFSPETVVEVSPDGLALTNPLAGTRPRHPLSDVDQRLHDELLWDTKECYEHVISARLADEEMRSVCDPRTVAVRDLLTVKQRGPVRHLASVVTGQLARGRDAWDAAEALFPAVTAAGIPKRPALELIAATEDGERGLYAGAVFMVDGRGFDSALVLRSIFQDAGGTWLRAGAGVVEGSDPAREYDETTNKLRSAACCLVPAAAAAEPGRAGRLVADVHERR